MLNIINDTEKYLKFKSKTIVIKSTMRSSSIIVFGAILCFQNNYDGYYDMPEDLEGPLYEQLLKQTRSKVLM